VREVSSFFSASQAYFGRPAARVSIDQAALLVATLPHPLTSNPSLRPGRTIWRQQLILRRLRGEAIVVPQEEAETVAPHAPAADSAGAVARDSGAAPPKDSAAAPAPKPDTAAAKPPIPPPPRL